MVHTWDDESLSEEINSAGKRFRRYHNHFLDLTVFFISKEIKVIHDYQLNANFGCLKC